MIDKVMLALNLATRVHSDQVRMYSNEPYINHVVRVATDPRVVLRGPEAICIALLHDSIEDSCDPEQIESYIKDNFSSHVYETCMLLSHLEGTYSEYKQCILTSNNVDALLIKAVDSYDNSKVEPGMPEKHLKRCETYKANVTEYLSKSLELELS